MPYYAKEEVDYVMRVMGWSESNPNYSGMQRTTAAALAYARIIKEDAAGEDPLNMDYIITRMQNERN